MTPAQCWEIHYRYVYPQSGRMLVVDTLLQAAADCPAAATVCSGENMWTITQFNVFHKTYLWNTLNCVINYCLILVHRTNFAANLFPFTTCSFLLRSECRCVITWPTAAGSKSWVDAASACHRKSRDIRHWRHTQTGSRQVDERIGW